MATRPESFGIYADLAAKRAANYDTALEVRVRKWIEGVLGRQLQGDFRESLMDGQVVCELINKLKPGLIKKIHKSSILMFRRENFGFFQNASLALGCKETETCVFEDVYDNRNMGQFLINICAIARQTQWQPGYKGPILEDAAKNSGPGEHAAGEAKYVPSYTEEAARQAQAAKKDAHFIEHGIISAPKDPTAPTTTKGAGKYIPSAVDEVALQAQAAKQDAHFIGHGIISAPKDPTAPTTTKGAGKYIPSAADEVALQVQAAKQDAHFIGHGIISAPQDPTAPTTTKGAGKYIPSAAEEAAAKGEAARNKGRYVAHGIVMNPDENPSGPPK